MNEFVVLVIAGVMIASMAGLFIFALVRSLIIGCWPNSSLGIWLDNKADFLDGYGEGSADGGDGGCGGGD